MAHSGTGDALNQNTLASPHLQLTEQFRVIRCHCINTAIRLGQTETESVWISLYRTMAVLSLCGMEKASRKLDRRTFLCEGNLGDTERYSIAFVFGYKGINAVKSI